MMAQAAAAGTNGSVPSVDDAIPAGEDNRDRVVGSEYDDEVDIVSVAYREEEEMAELLALLVAVRRGLTFLFLVMKIRKVFCRNSFVELQLY